MARKFPDYKKIITENNVLPYFTDVQSVTTCKCNCLDHILKSLCKNKEEWIEGIAPPWLNSFSWKLLTTLRSKLSYLQLFLLVYLISLLANLGMIILIRMDLQLHTPMYFFLSHISFCDICNSTAIGPKMLVGLFAKNKTIPFYDCILQFLVFCIFAYSECLLLAVMAYEWYKAVSSTLLWGVLPAHGRGLHGGNGRCSDTHNINILWVKWD